ncbi:MAG: phosphodiester glycosidase family protein [Nitrospiraceae bacterium]
MPARPALVHLAMAMTALCITVARPSLAQDLNWNALEDGLALSLWQPSATCHDVPPLLMVRIDPERFRFSIHHFQDEGLSGPLMIQDWQRRTGAAVVFNAGLFREDYSYLGLLLKGGRILGAKRHPSWRALFLAEPVDPRLRKARVLDLEFESFREDQSPYREAAQSLMLLDRTGKPRVRQTGKRAAQTVVAEDGAGRILIIKTTDVVSLHGLAQCLHTGFAAIRQAMAMDGGSSSDVYVSQDLLVDHPTYPWQSTVEGTMGRHIPLPTVISITPRPHITSGTRPTQQVEEQSRLSSH